ncbi:MAG: hypothetical protein PWR01_4492, partial [Clostridiales bacterium]|nr:hypothetical protein [Clostridiales bacterium]MDN5283419.1 hypothetical protein [Candidatus Ozemobacter sp.]
KYERVAEYERRFEEKLAQLDQQLQNLYLEMEAVRDAAYAPVYLSRIETGNKLIEIKRDIKSMIQKVAAQYKISVVLDSSFAMKTTRQKNPQASLYLQNDDFDVLSSSLFHDLTNIDYDMPPDAKQIGATPEHMMLGGAYAKLDTLRKVAQLRSYLLPAASEFSPGAIFVMGNVDLTPHVAKEIFDKYQLPETIKTSYVKVINDFLNLENSRYVEDPPRYPNEVHGGTHE